MVRACAIPSVTFFPLSFRLPFDRSLHCMFVSSFFLHWRWPPVPRGGAHRLGGVRGGLLSELPVPCTSQVRLHIDHCICLAVRVFLVAPFRFSPPPLPFLCFSTLRWQSRHFVLASLTWPPLAGWAALFHTVRLVRVSCASTPSGNARRLRSTHARDFVSLRTSARLSLPSLGPPAFSALVPSAPAALHGVGQPTLGDPA